MLNVEQVKLENTTRRLIKAISRVLEQRQIIEQIWWTERVMIWKTDNNLIDQIKRRKKNALLFSSCSERFFFQLIIQSSELLTSVGRDELAAFVGRVPVCSHDVQRRQTVTLKITKGTSLQNTLLHKKNNLISNSFFF